MHLGYGKSRQQNTLNINVNLVTLCVCSTGIIGLGWGALAFHGATIIDVAGMVLKFNTTATFVYYRHTYGCKGVNDAEKATAYGK